MGVIRCLIVKQLWAGSEFRNKATPAVDNRPSLLQFLFLAIRWIIDGVPYPLGVFRWYYLIRTRRPQVCVTGGCTISAKR
jgi:hypothetical protein